MKTIGPYIKSFRKSRSITQEQLAKALGYSHKSVITHIEKGESEMSFEKICLLLDTYNISADELFYIDSNKDIIPLSKTLKTQRLILRSFEEKDFEDLYEFLLQLKDDEFEPYPEISRKNCEKHFKTRLFSKEYYAIELKSNHKVIGNIYAGNRECNSKEIGYIVNKDYQRNGYAFESIKAVIKDAFSKGVNRVYAECDSKNEPSWRLLEKLGFTREATLKQNVYFKKDENGKPIWKDTYIYSSLCSKENFNNKCLGFLGLGKMGTSILKGVLKNCLYAPDNVMFYAPSEATKAKGIELGINLAKDERELFINSDIIVLAIKPQVYDEVFKKLEGIDFMNKIIISLAPGKSISYLSYIFKGASIVRAMPNTPSTVNKGVTTLIFDNEVKEEVTDIFSSIGTYYIVEKESQIDETIPLNGSMPAYLYEFVSAFVEASTKYGIAKDDARKMTLEAIIGCCELALNSEDDLDTLINNVCSKGGSTIKGLEVLRSNEFKETIKNCYDACVKRSKELGNS